MKLLFYEPESVYFHRPMVYHKITLLLEVLSKFFEYFLQYSEIIGYEIITLILNVPVDIYLFYIKKLVGRLFLILSLHLI